MVCPQPGANCFTQGQQDLAGILIGGDIPGQGDAVAVGLVNRFLFLHRIIIDPVGILVNELGVFVAQMCLQHLWIAGSQLADGTQSKAFHLFLGSPSHKEKLPDGQRPHLFRHFLQKQGMALVRLFKIRGHLGQKFVAGNTDVHSESQFPPDPFPYPVGCCQRVAKKMDGSCHIQEDLINAEFFMVRRIFLQQLHHFSGTPDIKIKTGRHHGQVRAFAARLGQGFSCGDPVFLCKRRFGQHNAVPHTGIPAHRGGDGAQIQGIGILAQPVHTFPAEKSGIYINVENEASLFRLLHNISHSF